MGLLRDIAGFFTDPADSFSAHADCGTTLVDIGGNVGDDMSLSDSGQDQGQDYCTASGSEPTWHNGFGTEADFTTIDTSSFDGNFDSNWEM
jgi:hypothetical protein